MADMNGKRRLAEVQVLCPGFTSDHIVILEATGCVKAISALKGKMKIWDFFFSLTNTSQYFTTERTITSFNKLHISSLTLGKARHILITGSI